NINNINNIKNICKLDSIDLEEKYSDLVEDKDCISKISISKAYSSYNKSEKLAKERDPRKAKRGTSKLNKRVKKSKYVECLKAAQAEAEEE
ncbi:MAG: hypothetical protein RSB87_03450, partial [Clostridia bacterium]